MAGRYTLLAMILTNCTFSGNFASNGGAIYSQGVIFVTTTSCIFSHDTASSDGGAIYNDSGMTLASCTFSGNNAGESGSGGAIINAALLNATSCTFSGNSADYGGAIYNNSSAIMTVKCSRFWGNTLAAGGQGSAINNAGSTVTATNNWWGSIRIRAPYFLVSRLRAITPGWWYQSMQTRLTLCQGT